MMYAEVNCIKRVCEFLREHSMKIINFKKKKMKLLTKEQQESYENTKKYYICKKIYKKKTFEDEKIQ